MSVAMMLKIFSDCCVCFAILGSGPVQLAYPLLLPAVMCGISAGIATFFQGKGWKIARWISGLLPLSCLLLAGNGQQMLILAVPALYTVVVILRGKLELEYYSYRQFFLRSLGLLGGAYVIVNVWIFLAMASGDSLPQMETGVILRYALVHLLCGIVLQRQLRLGVGYRSEGGRKQLSMLLGAVGAIVLASVAAEPLLREYALTAMKFVFTLIGLPIVLIVELFTWVMNLLERDKPAEQGKPTFQEIISGGGGAVQWPWQDAGQDVEKPVTKYVDPAIFWVALVAVFLLAVLVILFRSFQKRRAGGDPGEMAGRMILAPKKKKAPTLSNRNKVRQLYREFLRMEKGWGLKLRISDTSADVLRRMHPETDKQSAGELRQVYLMARYDDRKQISRSQVNRAKQALKGTRRTGK